MSYFLRSIHTGFTSSLVVKRFGGVIPVILLSDLPNRGVKGETVEVKRGYARNYLIPRQLAGK